MNTTKSYFAKPLPNYVKLITALKIVANTHFKIRMNAYSMLFWLLYNEEDMSREQKLALGSSIVSSENRYIIKEKLIDLYNDEDILIDFLNGKITRYYFVEKKKLTKSKTELDTSMKIIMSDVKLLDLMKDI